MLALALLVLTLAPRAAPDEFRERLTQLASPRAEERAAAARWLEAHLEFERYPELAESALAGDAEVRGRLVQVLSSDARHLGLALELCAEKDAGLATLGREAVRAGVARADPRLGRSGLRGRAEPGLRGADELELVLRAIAARSPPQRWRLDARRPLEQLCSELELVAELPVGLTLDARVAASVMRRAEELPGAPWDELVLRLARAFGVVVECHGVDPARAEELAPGAFLCLTREQEPPRTGAERITEWLVTLATDASEPARTRAALNLASSGFAPALTWMDGRFAARADPALRAGLLRAAALGRVGPALLAAPVFDALLAEAETRGGPESAPILCALARVGCFDAQGAPLSARLLAGFDGAGPAGRWTRLLLLERSACASAAAEAPLRALLAERATPAALRLRALFTLAAATTLGPEPPRTEELAALLRLGLDARDLQRLGRVLALYDLVPPHRDPAAIPRDWSARERLDLLQVWLWRGELEPIAAHVAAWLGGGEPAGARAEVLAAELAPWPVRGARPLLQGVLRRARELAPARAAELERLRLLLGLVPGPEVTQALAAGGHVLQGPAADLALLGALAGYPVAIPADGPAREQLHASLVLALQENQPLERARPLLAALERAVAGLYAAGRDELGDAFVRLLVQAAGRQPKAALARHFDPAWPPAPGTELRDAAHELARFEVPRF